MHSLQKERKSSRELVRFSVRLVSDRYSYSVKLTGLNGKPNESNAENPYTSGPRTICLRAQASGKGIA